MLLLHPNELPVINGERLYLRPITDADTEDIVRWRNDPGVWQYFLFREPFTPEMHRSWLKNKVAAGLVVQYIIVHGRFAGNSATDLTQDRLVGFFKTFVQCLLFGFVSE